MMRGLSPLSSLVGVPGPLVLMTEVCQSHGMYVHTSTMGWHMEDGLVVLKYSGKSPTALPEVLCIVKLRLLYRVMSLHTSVMMASVYNRFARDAKFNECTAPLLMTSTVSALKC